MGLRGWDSVPAHNKGFKDGNSSAATASNLWASEGGIVYLHTLDDSRKGKLERFLYSEKKGGDKKHWQWGRYGYKKNSSVLASKSTLSVGFNTKFIFKAVD